MPPSELKRLQLAAGRARERTLALVADLDDAQLVGEKLGTVNPLLWELGHIAWFQERWTARRTGEPSVRDDADAIYDSMQVPHGLRWDLPLPSRAETLAYLETTASLAEARASAPGATDEDRYHLRYTTHHEEMHSEAFAWARQAHPYPAPVSASAALVESEGGAWLGDVEVPGGEYPVGAASRDGFAFDNEKGQHALTLAPFAIAKAPVTQGEFAAFVDAGGYDDASLWSAAGLAFKAVCGAHCPVYWRREGVQWQRREFDRWCDLEPHKPVIHIAYYEAEAYCRWADRRLPSEAEWEVAAAWDPAAASPRTFPWGEAAPGPHLANLDGLRTRCLAVSACPQGDSALGCRQMLG
ncbi:MAG: SUMF1/EgtB/PvdO family nonheme iron enzyme, partial [Nannocystaceae bacterium]|nr:SUMF1/EgtB/PvdO family nonheme iron enzyme [Nannocystaceae bacterium]